MKYWIYHKHYSLEPTEYDKRNNADTLDVIPEVKEEICVASSRSHKRKSTKQSYQIITLFAEFGWD